MVAPPFAAAIFDMDGLLFDTEALGREAWGRALAEFGYRLDDGLYLSLVGRDMRQRERLLRKRFGPDLPFEAVKARRLELGEEQESGGALRPKPGAVELVRELAARRLPLAIATGTERPRARRRLEQAGLAGYFPVLVCAEDVAHGKPAPDIFLAAAERLGVAPARCLVFEDSCASVRAASAAGMGVVMVPDLEPAEPVADLLLARLESLGQAPARLPEWFGA